MGKKQKRKVLPNGRNANEQYAKLPYRLIQSETWRSLSGPAVKLWLELRSRYNGGNNGEVMLSMDQAKKLLSISKSTASDAYVELTLKGFLAMTKRGTWHQRMERPGRNQRMGKSEV